jgi:uncharacterized membrane protein
MKKILFLFILSAFLILPRLSSAQALNDWYIKNFDSTIVVNKDSSLSVTEKIIADCGNLPNKHGIFRILPSQGHVELQSITDFDGRPYKYQTIFENNTVTWKIGDPNLTVTGENDYQITYKIKDAIRFFDNYDEFYWNLSGNYWQFNIENFSAHIFLPSEVNKENTKISYYADRLGSNDTDLATYEWTGKNTLDFKSAFLILPGQGITASISFPKGIFTPYVPSFMEKYADYLWFLIPVLILIFSFLEWNKYGRDIKISKSIAPEFGIPENITPIQMGMVLTSGRWRNAFITASIIDLAIRKFIIITELDKKILGFTQKDFEFKQSENYANIGTLTLSEQSLLKHMFNTKADSVKLSDLKKKFYSAVQPIKNSSIEDCHKWLVKKSLAKKAAFFLSGAVIAWLGFFTINFSIFLFSSILISSAILFLFGLIMPQRTPAGADLYCKIKGFQLYMKTAENYRQQFYEKENIFDKLLPYAIIFGIAELWAKKMEKIYGNDYFTGHYHSYWYYGYAGTFDASGFAHQLNNITSSISSMTSSGSGAGGGGFSGGGGGGGGGGGW